MINCLLGDVAKSQTGPFGSQLHESDYVKQGTPIVTVEHLGEIGFTTQNLPFVSQKDTERLSRFLLKEGDIVFSRVGSIDRCVYVKKEQEGWLFSGRCLRVRCDEDKVNSRFLSYYFKLADFKKMMLNISVGATMPSLNTSLMDDIPLSIPERAEQDKIAALLDKIDAKIENNNSINEELRETVKTIYDYWFLQYEFPNEEGKPYKSSGGKMVWNEELKKEIPESWEKGTFSDLFEIGNGKDHKHLHEGTIPVYGSGGIMRYCDTPIFEGESVLIPRKGTLNNLIYVNGAFWTVDTMFYSKMKIDHAAIYAYYSLKRFDFEILNTGTGVPSMTSTIIYGLKTVIPNKHILAAFDKVVQPLYQRIKKNDIENMELSSLKDFLLPLLMNGQVTLA